MTDLESLGLLEAMKILIMINDCHLPAHFYAVLRWLVGLPWAPVGEGELRAVGPEPGVAAWAKEIYRYVSSLMA